jgi:hypothetical protein
MGTCGNVQHLGVQASKSFFIIIWLSLSSELYRAKPAFQAPMRVVLLVPDASMLSRSLNGDMLHADRGNSAHHFPALSA